MHAPPCRAACTCIEGRNPPCMRVWPSTRSTARGAPAQILFGFLHKGPQALPTFPCASSFVCLGPRRSHRAACCAAASPPPLQFFTPRPSHTHHLRDCSLHRRGAGPPVQAKPTLEKGHSNPLAKVRPASALSRPSWGIGHLPPGRQKRLLTRPSTHPAPAAAVGRTRPPASPGCGVAPSAASRLVLRGNLVVPAASPPAPTHVGSTSRSGRGRLPRTAERP